MKTIHNHATACKAFGFAYRTSEAIADFAVKNGWKQQQYWYDFQIDITEIFDEYSVEGNLLLDFITQTKDFRVVTEKIRVAKVLKHWLEDSVLGSNGASLVQGKIGAVVIFKT